MSVNSILNFLGGLFVLVAALIPLWQRAVERGYKHFLRGLALVVIEIALYISAVLMWFVFKNPGAAALLALAYLIVAVIEFGQRPLAIQRGELAFFVLWVAVVSSIVTVVVYHIAIS